MSNFNIDNEILKMKKHLEKFRFLNNLDFENDEYNKAIILFHSIEETEIDKLTEKQYTEICDIFEVCTIDVVDEFYEDKLQYDDKFKLLVLNE